MCCYSNILRNSFFSRLVHVGMMVQWNLTSLSIDLLNDSLLYQILLPRAIGVTSSTHTVFSVSMKRINIVIIIKTTSWKYHGAFLRAFTAFSICGNDFISVKCLLLYIDRPLPGIISFFIIVMNLWR